MIIKINGKNETIDKVTNILELIKDKGLSYEKIVVEHNFSFLPKEKWQNIILQESDNLEILSFVGGG